MKKCSLLLITAVLCSCAGIGERESIHLYQEFNPATPVYLEKIRIEPPELLEGIREELPEIVMSFLDRHGFAVSETKTPETVTMDIFIRQSDFQLDFRTYKSATLAITIKSREKIVVYSIFSEDTEKSLESFAWTLTWVELKISALADRMLYGQHKK